MPDPAVLTDLPAGSLTLFTTVSPWGCAKLCAKHRADRGVHRWAVSVVKRAIGRTNVAPVPTSPDLVRGAEHAR